MTKAAKIAALAVGLGTVAVALAEGAPRLTVEDVRSLANSTTARYFPMVSPIMLRAMVEIESSRNPSAVRVEQHISDASVGLMQTLVGTAQWLHDDMGYKAFARPDHASLLSPAASMYYGGAYVNWLRTYDRIARDERWIVESYNGGPGRSSEQTQNHFSKYQAAKKRLTGG